ncbi:MAG: RluA family pseudouridine synthase [Dictyoglomaceae bacterium]|nr:RluA family pseudouridine synthase [Dictyoglomaceae bacterium]HPU43994.1 RluA family pseudouridine synthase [Dictyoglomaceae bacterium]
MEKYILRVERDLKERVDKYLSEKLLLSRSQIQKLIDEGYVKVNEERVRTSYKVKFGDSIEVVIPPPESTEIISEDLPLEIVYEDEDLLVVNKPRGMVVHPAVGHFHGTLVNALLYKVKDLSGIGGAIRPGIVHRLDKNTTGLLVVAKNDYTHHHLSEQLKQRTLKRVYWALCEGEIPWDKKRVELSIGRHPVHRKKMAVVSTGKIAITNFEVLERFKGYTLVSARLETGRTHQVRVHLSHMGFPIVGDEIYGRTDKRFGIKGQLLHAKEISFIHPREGTIMKFTAPLPEDFQRVLDTLREES